MLVWCPKCGTSYDIEKRGSICPGCGYDRNEFGRDISDKKRKKRKEFWKFTKVQKIGCSIIVVLMILQIGLMFAGKTYLVNENEKLKNIGLQKQLSSQMTEVISLYGGHISFSDCEMMNDWDDKVPEGCSIILVSFTSDASRDYDTTAYLRFETGEYLAPLEISYLEEITGLSYNEICYTYQIKEKFYWSSGKIAYLVPDNVSEATLVLYSAKDNINLVSTVDRIYQIPLSWEVQ